MKKRLFIVGIIVAVALVAGTFTVSAQGISASELVELLITLGIIAPDKADLARQAVGSTVTPPILPPSTNCYTFTQNLMLGSRGEQVSQLQKVLKSEKLYTGDITGYFGVETKTAVINFQNKYGINPVGSVGPLTRAKLNALCTSSTPSISSISPTSGIPGSQINIYGLNFNSNSNVFFGEGAFGVGGGLVKVVSNSLIVFTLPTYTQPGIYNIAINNDLVSRVKSNSVQFTVTGNQPHPKIDSITVTPTGNNTFRMDWSSTNTTGVQFMFDSFGSAYRLDTNQLITSTIQLPSSGSLSLSFKNTQVCSSAVMAAFMDPLPIDSLNLSTYRKTLQFSLTSNTACPKITSVTPMSGVSGTQLTIHGSNFLTTGNDVAFVMEPHGPEFDINNISSPDGKTLSFVIPNSTMVTGEDGVTRTVYVTPGQYYFVVANTNGKSEVWSGFTVTSASTQSSASVSANLTSADSDKISYGWNPGPGDMNKNPNDWHVTATLSNASGKTIKEAYITSASYGEGWSTVNYNAVLGKGLWPLAVYKDGVRQVSDYSQNIPVTASSATFDLYSQPQTSTWYGGTLVMNFTDGTSATAYIPASNLKQVETPYVFVSSLNSGDNRNLALGSRVPITWCGTAQGDVDIYLMKGSETLSLLAHLVGPANSACPTGAAWTWTVGNVPSGASGVVQPGSNYKIRVVVTNSSGTPIAQDTSDDVTTISSGSSTQPSIRPSVSSVNPQPVQVGSTLTVYFTNGGNAGSVILKTLDGSKSWRVPYTTGTVYNGFVYYDGNKITLTVPSMIGAGQLPENSGYEEPIAITSGTYNLSVYSVGIIDSTGTVIQGGGTSDVFPITINVPPVVSQPSITVTSPNGGEVWQQGSTQTLRWSTSGAIPVDGMLVAAFQEVATGYNTYYITDSYCSTNSGGNCVSISANQFTFVVPSTLTPGRYKLRMICGVRNSEASCSQQDLSDNYFTITSATQPSITVTSPNGGETVRKGNTYRIKWDSRNVSKIYIKLRKGGDTYYGTEGNIVYGIQNVGYYDWVVPTTLPDGSDYTVSVLNYDTGGTQLDDSNSAFSIVASSPDLVPQNAIIPQTGSANQEIIASFDVANIGTQDLDLVKYTNSPIWRIGAGETSQRTISDGCRDTALLPPNSACHVIVGLTFANTGSYYGALVVNPDNNIPESNYINNADGSLKISIGALSIPSITVTSPNGGEALTAGSRTNITWNKSGTLSDTVMLEVRKGSSPYIMIYSAAPNTGSYSWPVLSGLVGLSDLKIRVTDQNNRSIYDESNAPFTVVSSTATSTISLGDRVQVSNSVDTKLNVRNSPGGSIVGSQLAGAAGTVTSYSDFTSGAAWRLVKFMDGITGWVAENFLERK